jgi:hypothetical protein
LIPNQNSSSILFSLKQANQNHANQESSQSDATIEKPEQSLKQKLFDRRSDLGKMFFGDYLAPNQTIIRLKTELLNNIPSTTSRLTLFAQD